jgi:tetratricopeptide (TPR) repeat protein
MSRGNIGLIAPSRDRERAERPSSHPKKRRNSTAKPEGLSLTIQDYGRKASVQPTKKISRSKFDSSNDTSLNKIFRKGSREKRVHTEAGLSLEDYKVPDMMSAYKNKDYSEAIDLGRDVLAENPKNLDALYIVGLASSMIDRHETTIKNFETLLSLKPQYKKNVYLLLSIAYKKLGKTEASFRVLNMALRHYDRFFEAYVRRTHADLPRQALPEAEQTRGGLQRLHQGPRNRRPEVQREDRPGRHLQGAGRPPQRHLVLLERAQPGPVPHGHRGPQAHQLLRAPQRVRAGDRRPRPGSPR